MDDIVYIDDADIAWRTRTGNTTFGPENIIVQNNSSSNGLLYCVDLNSIGGSEIIFTRDDSGGPFNPQNVTHAIIRNQFCHPITYGTDIHNSICSYTWIDGVTYTDNDTTATYVLSNSIGCDSVITLNLTIETLVANITASGNTLMGEPSGSTYQWLDCNNNNYPIPGENDQTFTPLTDGSYAVAVMQNGCSDTSSCYPFNYITSIKELQLKQIKILPNPTTGEVTLPEFKGKAILYDLFGNECLITSSSYINLSHLRDGMYLLKFKGEDGNTYISKIIKN